ncbi:MFS transporter [Lacisediminihabitans sp.]|uniref:MFS transporter n=1 Tax=Lacisediminihabitans sp. TaxID=2787631 RepID=UPI00374CCFEB
MVSRRGLGGAFSNLFTANLASSLGDGIARTAAPLLAARLTHDPVLIAGVAALALLPWLLFAIPSGILIDRIDRRRALALANTVRTVLAVALAVLAGTGTLTIWWLYLVIFVYGTFETLYDGAIRAVVPSIVGRADLARANSRIEAGELVVQNLLSGPFTSALFAISVLIPLGTNALVFAVAVVLAFLLPKAASGRQFAATRDEPTVAWYRQFVDGFRFIVANRMLRTLWFFSTFVGICVSAATASFVLYLLGPLGLPEALYGVFLLTGAAGGVLGAALASRLGSWLGAGLAMAIATLLDALALLFAGVVPVLWAVGLGFFVSTFAVTVWNILVMSLRQSIIPGRLLGRVHGTWRTLLWGSMPVGSIIGGLIGRVDLALPFTIGGAASALAAVVFFRFLMSLPNPENVDNGDRIEPAPTEGLLLD